MSDNNTIDSPTHLGDVTDAFRRIQGDVTELLSLARDKARVGMEAIGRSACDTSKRAVDGTRSAISAHPLRSAGIALAAGALIGWLVSRR